MYGKGLFADFAWCFHIFCVMGSRNNSVFKVGHKAARVEAYVGSRAFDQYGFYCSLSTRAGNSSFPKR